MADYILSCCSTADLTKEQFEEMDVKYICFHYEMDGKQYADDLGQTMPFDLFYQKMAQGADTKTSQVNAEEYEEYFEGFLKDGKDVLHLCLSSGISGTVNSANIAKEKLSEKYGLDIGDEISWHIFGDDTWYICKIVGIVCFIF